MNERMNRFHSSARSLSLSLCMCVQTNHMASNSREESEKERKRKWSHQMDRLSRGRHASAHQLMDRSIDRVMLHKSSFMLCP